MNAPVIPKPGEKPSSAGRPQGGLASVPKTKLGPGAASFKEILGKAAVPESGVAIPGRATIPGNPNFQRSKDQKSASSPQGQPGLTPTANSERRNKNQQAELTGLQGGLLARPLIQEVSEVRPRTQDRKEGIRAAAASSIRTPSGTSVGTNPLSSKESGANRRGVEAESPEMSKIKLTVVDRRRSVLVREPTPKQPEVGESTQGNGFELIKKEGTQNLNQDNNPTIWARMESPASLNQSRGSIHQLVVPQQFYEQLHGEFLDRAKLILKDGGGEMRLTIRPQNLGSLRLSVTLEERVLKGQIVVDNETVKSIVESQLDSLLRSFREGGFDPLELKVSVAGEDGHRGSQQQGNSSRHQKEQDFQQTQRSEFFERQNQVTLEA